jgi:hypothetical protein
VPCTAAVRPSLWLVFPSPCGQRLNTRTGACGGTATAVCPGSDPGQPSLALRRQGCSVARAAGPRHRRPRLRHEAHRRGEASAASRPPQARARVFASVCQSAQPPADRSVQRLIPRRRWTAPAICWAARPRSCPPSARQRARTDTAPCLTNSPPQGAQEGRHRRRCTLPVPLIPATPQPPPGGSADRVPLLEVSGGAAPATTGPLRSFLPPCKRLYCTAAGLLRQGQASRHAPAGRPPGAGRQRGREGVSDGPWCWRTAVAIPAHAGDRRRTRVLGAAQA